MFRDDSPAETSRSSESKKEVTGPRILVGTAKTERTATETRPIPRVAIQILGAAGFLLLAVSWSHFITTFFPYRFGVAAWEYAAITQTIDVMPMGIVGLALAATASITSGWRQRALLLIVLCVLTTVSLAAMMALMLLDLPIAWDSVPAAMHRDLIKSSSKAAVFAVLFGWFQIWVARLLWRARASRAA